MTLSKSLHISSWVLDDQEWEFYAETRDRCFNLSGLCRGWIYIFRNMSREWEGVGEMATKWSSRVKQHLARLLFLSTLIIISPLFLSALIIRHGPTLPRCAICALAFQMFCSGSEPSRDVWPKLGFGTDISTLLYLSLQQWFLCISSSTRTIMTWKQF